MTEHRDRFRRLYDDNYERILGYALRRTDTVDDAHDVVSETFLAAWRRLDDVPEGSRSRLWLYGTARNAVANHHRGRLRQRRLDTRLQGVRPHMLDGGSGSTPWEADELPAVASAFGRLSDGDRELLLLVGWEGLDAAALAEVLGCTRPSARGSGCIEPVGASRRNCTPRASGSHAPPIGRPTSGRRPVMTRRKRCEQPHPPHR